MVCWKAPELVAPHMWFLLFLPSQVPVRAAGGPISLDGQEHPGASSGASSLAQVLANLVLSS